jgi:hypothetical protein
MEIEMEMEDKMGGNKTCVLCGNASPISGALPITTFSAP